jgi:hypothetical protein
VVFKTLFITLKFDPGQIRNAQSILPYGACEEMLID